MPPAPRPRPAEDVLPPPRTPHRPGRLLAPAAWFAVVLGLSSIPASGFEGLQLPVDLSYAVHAVEYGVLGAALAWALEGMGRRVLVTAGIAVVAGAIDERWQATVPGRDAAVLDWAVDVVAATLAAALLVRMAQGGARPGP